jgi:sulfur relay (sulfurtransferase) complex TusBCD TusD component (DsrE family)
MALIMNINSLKPCNENSVQSLFLGVMGTPFHTDYATSVFRLANEALVQGKDVTIWTCGYSTTMTQTTAIRPENPIAAESMKSEGTHTLSELAQELLKKYRHQLRWYVCSYCMEERGATAQIPEVEIQLPFSFNTYLNQADQSLVFGTK